MWLIDEVAIDLDNFAGYRRIQIRRCLDGFDHSELFARLDVIAHLDVVQKLDLFEDFDVIERLDSLPARDEG